MCLFFDHLKVPQFGLQLKREGERGREREPISTSSHLNIMYCNFIIHSLRRRRRDINLPHNFKESIAQNEIVFLYFAFVILLSQLLNWVKFIKITELG